MLSDHIRYRIFEVDATTGRPATLFHGVNGSRVLPVGEPIEANRKRVRDGRGNAWYESGFHVFKREQDAYAYAQRFNRNRANARTFRVCPVIVTGDPMIKEHSPARPELFPCMLIPSYEWNEAKSFTPNR